VLATNTLSIANDSFKTVLDRTGSYKQAYEAAAFSLPAAFVGTLGEYSTIAKLANPAIEALGDFNKAKYLANVFVRNAAVGTLSNTAMDLTAQIGETLQTGDPINAKRLITAAAAGGVTQGALGTFSARGAEGTSPEEVVPSPKPSDLG